VSSIRLANADGANVAGSATTAAVTHISQASQLMSRLNQLAVQNPTQFKAVTSTVATRLAAAASSEKVEYAKRYALQAELSQVERQDDIAQGGASTPLPTTDGNTSSQLAFISALAGGAGGAANGNATDSGLAAGLAEAIALVNQELGIPA
jgi:hypothetical protein